jgi:hypothetical protein
MIAKVASMSAGIGHQRSDEHSEARAMPRDPLAEQRGQREGGEGRRGRQQQCQPVGEQRNGLEAIAIAVRQGQD